MSSTFRKVFTYASVVGLFGALVAYLFAERSVLGLNLLFGLVMITLGAGLLVAGAMANDSGSGGWFIGCFQGLTLTYPLSYLLGMGGSVWALHSDVEHPRELATWLASANGIHLLLIALLLGGGLVHENLERRRRQRVWDDGRE